MPETFDAYRKWLGIPPKDQPPNHCRLLAIELFEDDPDVIEAAADQRMAHVRTYQTGQNSALSQEILNQLSSAKLCLLDPGKKAAYDARLEGELAAKAQAAGPSEADDEPVAMPPISEFDAALATIGPSERSASSAAAKSKRQRRPAWRLPAALVAMAVLLLAALVWMFSGGRRGGVAVAPLKLRAPTAARQDGTKRRAAHREETPHADQPMPPAVPPPQAASPDREVAEEVLRRGGQLRLSVNGHRLQLAAHLEEVFLPWPMHLICNMLISRSPICHALD